MCATCVAQGAVYLVPAYAVVKTQARWRRRRSADDATEATGAPTAADADLAEAGQT